MLGMMFFALIAIAIVARNAGFFVIGAACYVLGSSHDRLD